MHWQLTLFTYCSSNYDIVKFEATTVEVRISKNKSTFTRLHALEWIVIFVSSYVNIKLFDDLWYLTITSHLNGKVTFLKKANRNTYKNLENNYEKSFY